jgi:hypothetical protein
MLKTLHLEDETRMREMWASCLCTLALLLALSVAGCQSSYSGDHDATGRQRIYRISEDEVFAIARESLVAALPEAEIEKHSKPARRYRVRGYRTVRPSAGPLRTTFEVFPLRVEGKTRSGERVTGYYFRVASVSSSFLGQDSEIHAITDAFKKRLEETRTGVWVSAVRRLPYQSSAPGTQETGGEAPAAVAEAQTAGAAAAPSREGRSRRILCFAVRRDGLVLTPYRTISKAGSVAVHLSDGRVLDATLEQADEERDLALLRIDAPTPQFLALAPSGPAQAEQSAFSLAILGEGDSGFRPAFTEISIDDQPEGGDSRLLRFSSAAPLRPGAPLVNQRGEVMGVIPSAAEASASGEAALPPKPAAGAIRAEHAAPLFQRPLAVKPARSSEEAIRRAKEALCFIEAKSP